jgi:hypothetical protein
VVGVGVRLEDVLEAQAQAFQVREVAFDVLVDGVDDDGGVAVRRRKEVRERGRRGVEQRDRVGVRSFSRGAGRGAGSAAMGRDAGADTLGHLEYCHAGHHGRNE